MTINKGNRARPITIFTPSWADEDNTNAQNLTVKEVVARLPEDIFRVVMSCNGKPDPRLAARKNTILLKHRKHGNTVHLLTRLVLSQPDIYFFPRTGPLDRAVLASRKSHLLRSALVTYIVMAMNDATSLPLIERCIREGTAVIGNSQYVAETVRQRFGTRAGVICDGVDARYFFPPASKPDGPPTVLYAGSFQARKRVERVIEQAARWSAVQFRLAGRGETELGCRALADRLGCRNVTFLGHLPSNLLGEEMRKADVFLFPSVLEGHPQVLLQAAASGLPAVAMNVYHPDYVVHGETGFLVESDEQLAEKLDLLLADPGLRRAMSAASVRHVRQYDWDRITQQWAEVFLGVAKP